MRADTRLFGEIEIEDEKIIKFEQGIIGFPDLKHFALIFDVEKGEQATIKWLQSMDEPEFAMPVVSPYDFKEDYAPTVNDEMIKAIGEIHAENIYVLTTVTVPEDISKISINLKAPFLINTDTNCGAQIILEDAYPVKYSIYDHLEKAKQEEGE